MKPQEFSAFSPQILTGGERRLEALQTHDSTFEAGVRPSLFEVDSGIANAPEGRCSDKRGTQLRTSEQAHGAPSK